MGEGGRRRAGSVIGFVVVEGGLVFGMVEDGSAFVFVAGRWQRGCRHQ
jgi:hypothetical protein